MSSKKPKCTHVSKEHMFEGQNIALQQARHRAEVEQINSILAARAVDYATRIKKLYGADLAKGDTVNFETGAIVYAKDAPKS